MKIVPTLYASAAVLAVTGLCLRVARPALPSVDATQLRIPSGQQPAATGDVAPAPANDQVIVAQNIFSQSRGAEPPRPAPASRPGKSRETVPELALSGTTIGPSGAVALIGAQVHRVGDVIDGAKLVAITDSTVTLERPSGSLVLHVPNSQRKKL